MYTKNLISSNEFVKPLTRSEIAAYLVQLNKRSSELNKTEKELLDWFNSEYYYDIQRLNDKSGEKDFRFAEKDEGGRWRLLHYSDSLFTFYFNPLLYLSADSRFSKFQWQRVWGFNSYGSIGNNFGFQIDFGENYSYGENYPPQYYLSGQTGYIISHSYDKGFEYSETNGAVTYQNNWMTLSAVKQHFNIGSGRESQLVLSSRPPSFPSIYLKLNPLPWFNFYFIHGWLLSGITDSSRSYHIPDFNNTYRRVESDKYYVMHALQITPWDDLSFTAGETIIYSDRNVYFGYFIPFLFFRSVDHMFTYGEGDSGNNGSFFFDLKYRPAEGVSLYTTIFLDEFSLTNLLKGSQSNNQAALTIGGNYYTDLEGISVNSNLEYTRIQPWVYSNWIPTQTYENHFYPLGHYIGQNADEISLSLRAFFSARLSGSLKALMIRKGGMAAESDQYLPEYQKFLYGNLMKEYSVSPAVTYRFLHSLTASVWYNYTHITDEDKNRTPDFMLGGKHSLGAEVRWGF